MNAASNILLQSTPACTQQDCIQANTAAKAQGSRAFLRKVMQNLFFMKRRVVHEDDVLFGQFF